MKKQTTVEFSKHDVDFLLLAQVYPDMYTAELKELVEKVDIEYSIEETGHPDTGDYNTTLKGVLITINKD